MSAYDRQVLFKATSKRAPQSQSELKSRSIPLKYSSSAKPSSEDIYVHTYGIPLPRSSVDILSHVVLGLTKGKCMVNPLYRELHTIETWFHGSEYICRCCFIQPELSSATGSLGVQRQAELVRSCNVVSASLPGSSSCTVSPKKVRVQVSGRMAPYVVDEAGLGAECTWGFANVSRSKILFIYTSNKGPTVLTLTRDALKILASYMPSYGACVFSDSMSCYKVTVSPEENINNDNANKNTCMLLYNDGTFRIQGTPSKSRRVCECVTDAILTLSTSRSWPSFLRRMRDLTTLNADD